MEKVYRSLLCKIYLKSCYVLMLGFWGWCRYNMKTETDVPQKAPHMINDFSMEWSRNDSGWFYLSGWRPVRSRVSPTRKTTSSEVTTTWSGRLTDLELTEGSVFDRYEATDMNVFRSALSACVVADLPNINDFIHQNRHMLMEEKRQKLLALNQVRILSDTT